MRRDLGMKLSRDDEADEAIDKTPRAPPPSPAALHLPAFNLLSLFLMTPASPLLYAAAYSQLAPWSALAHLIS